MAWMPFSVPLNKCSAMLARIRENMPKMRQEGWNLAVTTDS